MAVKSKRAGEVVPLRKMIFREVVDPSISGEGLEE
jgi:hypothetical protein